MEENKRLSFGEWLENMWYHYKWLIIFGGLIVIMLVMSLTQCMATKDPDVNILHVGPIYLAPETTDDLKGSVGKLSSDYNEDGKIKVEILDISVVASDGTVSASDMLNYDQANNALQRFQTEIRAGDSVIYLLDKRYFDICMAENLLTPLSEILDDADIPANTVEGYGIYVSELDAFELEGLSSVSKDAILCLRRSPDKDEVKYPGRTMDVWNGNRKTFIKLVQYDAE